MHNKIIKYALVLLATASSIFAWTQATEIQNCQTKEYSRGTAYTDCFEFAPNETLSYNGQYNEINNKMSFLYDSTYNIFHMEGYDYGCKTTIYRDENKKLSGILEGNGGCTAGATLYEYKKICKTNYKTYTGIIQECFSDGSIFNTAIANTDIQEFYEENGTIEKYLFIPRNMRYSRTDETKSISAGALCTIFTNNTYCVPIYRTNSRENNGIVSGKNINSLTNGTAYTELQSNNLLSATSPFTGSGNGGGNTTTITTGTICPMIQFQIDMYGNKYNTGLCYTNTIEYTGGSIQTVTPKDIFEIFNSYTDYINRYNLWNNSCHAPYTQEYCNNVMQDNWRATQIFNKIEKAGVDSEKVYQYCHLQLHFTEEQKKTLGTCQIETETDQQQYATGTNQQNSNPNPLEGLTNALQNGTLDEPPIPNTGTVFDEILPEGVLTRKDVVMDYNFYSHFSMLYIKITKLFQARGEQDGIIPQYITSLLLLILLFKIYKK